MQTGPRRGSHYSNWETIKYVDDTTLFEISKEASDSSLQSATTSAITWSDDNDMKINASKTKEMLICFARKHTPQVPQLVVNSTIVERVHTCTLLGIELCDTLTWHGHIDKIVKKANTRLFYLRQLKRAKLAASDIISAYLTIMRPILEYACQVWHPGLTEEQHNLLEGIQIRTLSLAYPNMDYCEALTAANLPTLRERRSTLCQCLYNKMQDPNHKLHGLLPPKAIKVYNTRSQKPYNMPICHTDRFKKSFIPYCIANF